MDPVVPDTVVMTGLTVKLTPLLEIPAVETTTFPDVAVVGTGTTMLVQLQLVGTAMAPLNVTVLDPCVDRSPFR